MSEPVGEFVLLEALRKSAPAWRDLCARAVEPNPFAEPDFLLPLLDYEQPRGLAFALVFDATRLIGFAALRPARFGLGLAHIWRSAYAPLPAYAFDRDATLPALRALERLLKGRAGLVWPLVERDGPLGSALRAVADAAGLPLERGACTRRAALRIAGAAAFEQSLAPERRKRWARQARRLAARGRLVANHGPDAIEAFLEVERKGWKGARRTALADDPARLAFAREALGAFARAGRLDAAMLSLDGRPIAAGLLFLAGARGYYWKNAYDED